MPVLAGAVFFAAAGRFDLPAVWAVLGLLSAFCVAVGASADPSMIRERYSPGPGNQDRLTRPAAGVVGTVHWVVAGLDVGRFHWSPIPWQICAVGVAGYAISLMILWWVMRTNPFYSSVVRIQSDRGHYLITGGPYRYVRHPGYAATILAMISGGLAFGSWWAMLPMLVFVALFVRRLLLEDRFLHESLPGYVDYASRTRYRVIPGVF